MSKNFDDRVAAVLATIKQVDNPLGVRIETYYGQQAEALRQSISGALSYGWRGFGEKEDAETALRALRRAIVMLRMLFDSMDEKAAKAGLDGNAGQLNYILGQAVRDGGRRAFAHQLDLTHMRGRMEVIGSVSNLNRGRQWFTDQFALFDHFSQQVAQVQLDRRGFYQAALATAGIIAWGPNEPKPENAGRFDQFEAASTLCRLANGQTIRLNCWEAVLLWAYQAKKISVKKCKSLYGKPIDMIGNLFGLHTAFHRNTAQPGDILTYFNAGHVNHVAMYAGIGPDNEPYVLHCLATRAERVGDDYSTTHFLSQTDMLDFYNRMYGPAIAYSNTPFWIGGAPTHAYYNAL